MLLFTTTYEGVKVDWSVIIADSVRVAIQSVVDGKKVWTAVAQWLTLLAPPVPTIKVKKWGRVADATPNKPSKRQQLLAKHTPGWTEGGLAQKEKEQPSRKRQVKTEAPEEPLVKPLKIKLRWQERDPPTLAQRINIGTQEEEAEEEPADTPLCRRKRSDAEQKGDKSGPVKDNTLTPRSEGLEPMKEMEPDRPVTAREVPISPGRQAQQ